MTLTRFVVALLLLAILGLVAFGISSTVEGASALIHRSAP